MSPGLKRRSGSYFSSLVQPQTAGSEGAGALRSWAPGRPSLDCCWIPGPPGFAVQKGIVGAWPWPPAPHSLHPAPGGPSPGRHTDVTQALSGGPWWMGADELWQSTGGRQAFPRDSGTAEGPRGGPRLPRAPGAPSFLPWVSKQSGWRAAISLVSSDSLLTP